MSGTFILAGIDLLGAFAFLALVSFMPFSMYATTHSLYGATTAIRTRPSATRSGSHFRS